MAWIAAARARRAPRKRPAVQFPESQAQEEVPESQAEEQIWEPGRPRRKGAKAPKKANAVPPTSPSCSPSAAEGEGDGEAGEGAFALLGAFSVTPAFP